MKKIFAFILALCMVFSLVACATSNDTPTVTETLTVTEPTVVEEVEIVETEETFPDEDAEFVPSPEAPILDFDVTGFDVVEDYDGNPALVVYLIWTNTTDETRMFAATYGVDAFQDGIGLDPAILVLDDETVITYTDTMTEIRPGATIEVMVAFALRSDSPIIEVEVDEFLDLDGKPLMLLAIDTSAKG